MSRGARIASWLRALAHPRRLAQQMDEEMAFHIDRRAADLVREGLTPEAATRQARIEFGAVATHRHGMRVALGLRGPDEFLADLAYGARLLRKSPGFTAVTVLSLALAIGANCAIFSAANELLFARLGVPHAKQLRTLEWSARGKSPIHMTWGRMIPPTPGRQTGDVFSYPVYRQLAADAPASAPVFAFKAMPIVNATFHGVAHDANAEMVSGNYYAQLGVRPVLGRSIQPVDDRVQAGAPLVAVLSYGYWQREFGGSRAVLGAVISIDGSPATIIGVNPQGFTGAASVQISPDLFVPLTAISLLQPTLLEEDPLTSDKLAWVELMERAKPGLPDSKAEAALTVSMHAAVRSTLTVKKDENLPDVVLQDGSRGLNMSELFYARPLYILLTLVSLVLLLACVNVANLMLARAAVRERELSVRMALGAGRARIFRQMLTECLLLSVLGGALGFALAFVARNTVPRLLWGGEQSGSLQVPFDWRVFAFTAGVTLLSAFLSGVAPAWRATRAQPGNALKEASRAATRRRKLWSGKGLVALQVALSTLLVAGSALFLRTVVKLDSVDPGFNPHGLLLFAIVLPQHRYPAPTDLATHRRILAAIRAVPGVQSASQSGNPLLSGYVSDASVALEHHLAGAPVLARSDRVSDISTVAPDFLRTMQIPLLAGRAFSPSDLDSTQAVALVNRAFATKFFGNLNPLGRHFRISDKDPWTTIIGICADTRYNSLRDLPPPIFFSLYSQLPSMAGTTYLVRTRLRPASLVPSLRDAVARIDPDVPLLQVRTQEQQIADLTKQERLFADLTAGFGLLALALACTGIYGVLCYAVAGRTHEIGIRLALGAPQRQVRGMVLREAAWLALTGVVIGLAAAFALVRLVHSLLYGIATSDPLSFTVTAGLLLAVALLAAWLPAARAARVDPMESLRHD